MSRMVHQYPPEWKSSYFLSNVWESPSKDTWYSRRSPPAKNMKRSLYIKQAETIASSISQIDNRRPSAVCASHDGDTSDATAMPPLRPLYKQMSWSPDVERDEAWLRRKGNHKKGLKRSNSVIDDDLEELKGCIDLGFGFAPDWPYLEPRLSNTLPALKFYCAVNRQFTGRLSRSSSSSSIGCDRDSGSSTSTIFEHVDDPKVVKTTLRQWAQVVACSVQQFYSRQN